LNRNLLLALMFFIVMTPLRSLAEIQIIQNVPSTYMFPANGFMPFNLHRGTQTLLSLMLYGTTFDDPQGIACALLTKDHDPNAPFNDVVITVIGVNSGAGELIYNVGLKDLRKFGSKGSGDRQFLNPMGAAIHPSGNVAIADTGNNRIALLHHDGLRLRWVKAVGTFGSRPGEFKGPRGVAYDTDGNLYIADTGNNRIQVRTRTGAIRVLDTPPLEGPLALCVMDSKSDWTFYRNGPAANRLAVIDRGGQRVQTLTLDGSLLAQFTSDQVSDPPMQLSGCAFDYYGNLVATDFAKGCLRKFGRNLEYLTTFGSEGEDDFQFEEPRGICINNQFGQLIVSEKESAQYYWIGADALNLAFERAPQGIRFPFFLTERALVTAEIKDSQGTTIKSLAKDMDLEEGNQELDWTPDPSLPAGNYTFRMRVMATYSSREREAKEFDLTIPYAK